MKRNQKGFGIIEVVLALLILLVIGSVGYYVWHSHEKSGGSSTASSESSSAKGINASNQTATQDFYTCANGDGSVSGDHKPFTCTINGSTYAIPDSFTTEDIKYYKVLPASSIDTVTSLAKTNFDTYRTGCVEVSSSCGYPQTTVEIATSNFIYLTVDNYFSPTTPFLALQDGKWVNVGSTDSDPFFLSSCDNAKKYNITKASIVDPEITQVTTVSDCANQ